MASEVAKAYAAGIIDADGSIFIRKGGQRDFLQPAVQVIMTDADPIAFLAQHFGSKLIVSATKTPVRKLPLYRWLITGRKAQEFLVEILPYLTGKVAQAELALSFGVGISGRAVTDIEHSDRLELQEKISLLNRKVGS